MFAAIVVLLSAAPQVLVSNEPERVKALFPGREFVDASAVHAYFFKDQGILGFSTFGDFKAAPIAGWPPALNAAWKDGVAYCAEISGPQPWGKSLLGARCCGQRLAIFLWGRYLDSLHADQVYDVTVFDVPKGASVYGFRYTASSSSAEQIGVTEKGPAGSSEALLKTVVAALQKGEGGKSKRAVVGSLFIPALVDPYVAKGELPPLELKKKCEALPSALKFKNASATATALASRWATAAPGSAAPLDCALSFTTHQELSEPGGGMFGDMTIEVVTTVLRCGTLTASSELMKGPQQGPRPQIELTTTNLAENLVRGVCK